MDANLPFRPPQRAPPRPRRLPEHLLRLQVEYGLSYQVICRLADLWMEIYDLEQKLQNREMHPSKISEARRWLEGLKLDYDALEEDARVARDRRPLRIHGGGRENEDNRVEQRPVGEGRHLSGLRTYPRRRLPVMHGALEGGRAGSTGAASREDPIHRVDRILSELTAAGGLSSSSSSSSEEDHHEWSRGGSRAQSPSATRQPGDRGSRLPIGGQDLVGEGEQGHGPRSRESGANGGRQEAHTCAETISAFSEGTRL